MHKTEEDFWAEMSIREIWTQCHFALIAYENIDKKAASPTDQAFSSIHSFLSHAANVSKMLKSIGESDNSIASIIHVDDSSVIHERSFRNHLEHYDERLKNWIRNFAPGASVGTYNIGPKSMFRDRNMILVSHYDPKTKLFTFIDQDFDLSLLHGEIVRIQRIADEWVGSLPK